ncbi:MAG: FtsX-like permease family protein, partial [Actinomycetota bacterium]
MLRLTLRNLAANKARFAMTTFAVVLGVGFVVASFVLSDGLRSTFSDLSEEITGETDLVVRPAAEFGEPLPLDESLVAEINAIDGVANAVAFVEAPENGVQPVKADGTTIPTAGPPQLTFSWTDDSALGSFTIIEGEAPDEPGEFTMDLDAAANNDFVVGESYDLITPIGVEEDVTLVGTTSFGQDNATVGATLMHVSLDEAQRIFGEAGTVDSIPVRLESGADSATVMASVASAIDLSAAEVVDQATITAEQEADFNEGINIVGNVLLGFAIVSLFVSIFIIYNTFAIVLGQRVREIGLLRAIGANATQLRRSIILESVIVGVVASAIGIVAGIGIAEGLIALFDAIGAQLPDSPTIVAARTIIFALVLGIGVTVISAVAPARQAASISPIQALRDGGNLSEGESARRLGVGVAGLVLGVALGAFGLFAGAGSTRGTIHVRGGAATAIIHGAALA